MLVEGQKTSYCIFGNSDKENINFQLFLLTKKGISFANTDVITKERQNMELVMNVAALGVKNCFNSMWH